MLIYDSALTMGLAEWQFSTFKWVLMRTGSFTRGDAFLSTVLASGSEVSVSGYSRATLVGATQTLNSILHQFEYGATAPNFGALAAGQTVTALVLYQLVTTDANSIPIGWQDLGGVATNVISPFVVSFPSNIVISTNAKAGS